MILCVLCVMNAPQAENFCLKLTLYYQVLFFLFGGVPDLCKKSDGSRKKSDGGGGKKSRFLSDVIYVWSLTCKSKLLQTKR